MGSNCEEDGGTNLQSLNFFLTKGGTIAEPVEELSVEDQHLLITLVDTDDLINNGSAMAEEKCAAVAYCSGWLVQH